MFNISKDTFNKLQNETIKPVDLVLEESTTKDGRVWTIRTKAEKGPEGVLSTKLLAEGKDVTELLHAVANGKKCAKEFTELADLQKFRVFSRRIPKMETPEHREKVQSAIKEKFGRAKDILKVMVKGAPELSKKGRPSRIVDNEYVLSEIATDRSTPIEAARKFTNFWKESDTPLDYRSWLKATEKEWKESKSLLELLPWLSAREWDKQEKKAWESDNPKEIFSTEKFEEWKKTQYKSDALLPEPEWLLQKMCSKMNEAFKRENKPEETFEVWTKNEVDGRKQWWKDVPMRSEGLLVFDKLDDVTFKRLDTKMFEYDFAGSPLPPLVWIAKELWKETNPSDKSDEAFVAHIEHQQWVYSAQHKMDTCEAQIKKLENSIRKLPDSIKKLENPTIKFKTNQAHIEKLQIKMNQCKPGKAGRAKRESLNMQIAEAKQQGVQILQFIKQREEITKLKKELGGLQKELVIAKKPSEIEFKNWRENRDAGIKKRWEMSRSPLSLETWKSHQVLNPLVPMPFVSLNKEERKAYETQCVKGVLSRGTGAFPTLEEQTAHSGKGWVIFVIGPNEDLYCGSHLPGVFHHSSFLGDSAVMAGGEIKTDENGKITHISSKSGHYKPTDKENMEMLRWFQKRGVDLKDITFSCFVKDGQGASPSVPMKAQDYLNGVLPVLKKRQA